MESEERIASSNVNLFRRMYSDVGYCLQCSSCHCSTLCSLLCPCVKWFGRPEKSGMELIWLLADLFSFREFQKWELCEFFHEIDFKPSEWSFHNVTLPQNAAISTNNDKISVLCVSLCVCVFVFYQVVQLTGFKPSGTVTSCSSLIGYRSGHMTLLDLT